MKSSADSMEFTLLSASSRPLALEGPLFTFGGAAPRSHNSNWPLSSLRSSISPPIRRSIQSFKAMLGGRKLLRQRCTCGSWPRSERSGQEPAGLPNCTQTLGQTSRYSRSALRKASSPGVSSLGGRPRKNASRLGAFGSCAVCAGGGIVCRPGCCRKPPWPFPAGTAVAAICSYLAVTKGRALGVRCTISWPLASGLNSTSPPIRCSTHSFSGTSGGKKAAVCRRTPASFDRSVRVASSRDFHRARNSKTESRSASSSGANALGSRLEKNVSRSILVVAPPALGGGCPAPRRNSSSWPASFRRISSSPPTLRSIHSLSGKGLGHRACTKSIRACRSAVSCGVSLACGRPSKNASTSAGAACPTMACAAILPRLC
mmetsp:Transcript_20638/g.56972  ORF Transcript_20638/g.56972 Transcript_20638/m.56972 type:complete len:374 (-) Transcript_20638:46-1167(-)